MNNQTNTEKNGNTIFETSIKISNKIKRGKPVDVEFSLKNLTDENLHILKWYTPLEGLAGDIFEVKRNDDIINYNGILAKRGTPLKEEYIKIEPGKSITKKIDIAMGYDFTKVGNYSIQFASASVAYFNPQKEDLAKRQDDLNPVLVTSNPVNISIIESDNNDDETEPEQEPPVQSENSKKEQAKQNTYDDCSSSETTTVESAETSSKFKLEFIYSHLNGLSTANRQTDTLYKTWFGSYTSSRYGTVLNNFKKLKDAFNSDITYNCSGPACQPSWLAYVYSGGKVEVFLCQQFWNAPDSGTDTKYGTLIHEVSHEVCSTKDHKYGQYNCKNLATNDPDKAIENADNYEYFSEHYKLPSGCTTAITNIFKKLLGSK